MPLFFLFFLHAQNEMVNFKLGVSDSKITLFAAIIRNLVSCPLFLRLVIQRIANPPNVKSHHQYRHSDQTGTPYLHSLDSSSC